MDIALIFAAVAIILAVILFFAGGKSSAEENQPGTHFSPQAAVPPDQMPVRKRANKRGWKAPAGHYFNELDELVTITGDLVLDLIIIAQLCGEEYTEPAPIEEPDPASMEEPVGTETIASHPEPVEVASDTKTSSYSDTSSYDSGDSYDSGGDSGGGGGDSGGGGD